jgi:SAM-dependent methyltransferase
MPETRGDLSLRRDGGKTGHCTWHPEKTTVETCGPTPVKNTTGPAEPDTAGALARLPYFVDWRPRLWVPPVQWLLGDLTRFRGKRVLDMGCRTGRMSCLFGLLGAEVLGVDLPGVSFESARQEAADAGVSGRVQFVSYSGKPATLAEGDFDFVFTKSTLVMIPDLKPFLRALAVKMKPGGELLAAENLAGGWLMQLIRRLIVHRHRHTSFMQRIHGVNAQFLATFDDAFAIVGRRDFAWLVAGIRARRN